MTDAISNNNSPQNNAVKVAKQTKAGSGANHAAASQKNSSAAIVDLDSANLLQRLNDQIRQLPDVNAAKIESIKQALINGEYQPDAEVIAKKFSEIEKLLP